MEDNQDQRAPADESTVNVNEPSELAWWAKKLAATYDQLKSAVAKVGPDAINVESEIRRTKGRENAVKILGRGKRTKELELTSWSELETALQTISDEQQARHARAGRRIEAPLFRGQGSSTWGLGTTLERSHPTERCDETLSLRKYYRKIMASKAAVETLTGKRWDKLPDPPTFQKLMEDNFGWLDMLLAKTPDFYEYLVHLRHHGFPSPLLDWTASPYIAAFFAFDNPPEAARRVAIYAFLQDTIHGGSSDAHLFLSGRYIRTHPRHIFQQCNYSMCVTMHAESKDFLFCGHEVGMKDAVGPEGEVFKITLPIQERLAALKNLDLMNINAFSLFGSEDSLVRTVGRRECLFKSW